jgi:hypothetical protein
MLALAQLGGRRTLHAPALRRHFAFPGTFSAAVARKVHVEVLNINRAHEAA